MEHIATKFYTQYQVKYTVVQVIYRMVLIYYTILLTLCYTIIVFWFAYKFDLRTDLGNGTHS